MATLRSSRVSIARYKLAKQFSRGFPVAQKRAATNFADYTDYWPGS
jgi:hypothetical protein